LAHKKRKEEAEDDFELPKFDEAEFMRADIQGTKASIATILWAVPSAVIAFLITVYANAPVLALGVGLLLMVSLRRVLPLLRIDTKAFKVRDWLGHSSTFFFSWLAFWILLMNPPFGDFTPPQITSVSVNGTLVQGGEVNIAPVNWTTAVVSAIAGDNAGLASVTLTAGGNTSAMTASGTGNYSASLRLSTSDSVVVVTVVATDTSGHVAARDLTLRKN